MGISHLTFNVSYLYSHLTSSWNLRNFDILTGFQGLHRLNKIALNPWIDGRRSDHIFFPFAQGLLAQIKTGCCNLLVFCASLALLAIKVSGVMIFQDMI